MYVEGEKLLPGRYKGAVKTWIYKFKESIDFRKQFCCLFYITLVMFRTLFNRSMWTYPLSNVLGVWGIFSINQTTGECIVVTEGIENIVLFIPLLFLLFWSYSKQLSLKGNGFWTYFKYGFKLSFAVTSTIEFIQLFLRLGAFQLSDIAYNTLGGIIGTILYWLLYHKRL